eukprot:scaffold17084_cov152-Skeletonema_menzelii.AAC.1
MVNHLFLLLSIVAVHSSPPSTTNSNKYLRRTEGLSEAFQSMPSCPRKVAEQRNECLAKQQTSSEITVHCCSGTLGSDLSCKRPSCQYMNSYADAETFCQNGGMRLCTVSEINSNACCDQGCGFNSKLTWTSSVCSVSDGQGLSPSSPPTTSTPFPTTPPPTRGPSAYPSTSPVSMSIASNSPTAVRSNSPVVTAITSTTSSSPTAASVTSLSPSVSSQNSVPKNVESLLANTVEVPEEALTTASDTDPIAYNSEEDNVDSSSSKPDATIVATASTGSGDINNSVLGIFFTVLGACMAAFIFVAFVQGRKKWKMKGATVTDMDHIGEDIN